MTSPARAFALLVSANFLGACAHGPTLVLSPQPKMQGGCASGGAAVEGVRKIAVLPFASSSERRTETYEPPPAAGLPPKPMYRYLPDDGAAATTAVETAFSAIGGIVLIERRELARVLDEQRLQLTGLVSAREAAQVGKLSAADAVLLGQVNHAFAGYENKTAGGAWVGTYIPHADLTLRLVRVESGDVVWSCQLSRSALSYLKKPLILETRRTLADPHAYDSALLGSSAVERLVGFVRSTARDAAARLIGPQ
ncbi:MAG: hypothetical protein HY925_15090 [Elusimicrobia bacterium]|nr:hypothetical protein [Elusimicrobiota bacterium]